MDKLLSDEYVTDLADIKAKLTTKRQEQSSYNDDIFSIQEYEKEYVNYPAFISHLPGNDKKRAEEIELELARTKVAAAVSGAAWP